MIAVPGHELHWTQPDPFARAYELRADADLVATMRWLKPWGSLAEAKARNAHWIFTRDGFWQARLKVQWARTGGDVAIFRAGFAGAGIMEAADGRLFHWGSANFWQSAWAWESAARSPLLLFKSKQGLRTMEARVIITPHGAGHPDLALLACLGWYLLLPAREGVQDG